MAEAAAGWRTRPCMVPAAAGDSGHTVVFCGGLLSALPGFKSGYANLKKVVSVKTSRFVF